MFFMMIGLPGSGKSTYAKELAKEYNAVIFSSDAYREKIFSDENCQRSPKLVFDTLYNDMFKALDNNINVIFDATNIKRADRQRCLDRLSKYDTKRIACVMNTPTDVCIARDSQRDRTVGMNVINNMFAKFEPVDISLENFDEIWDISNGKKYSQTHLI